MKDLLFWRRLDLVGQLLMLLPLIAIVSPENRGFSFLVYLTLGAWHLFSCIINAIARPQLAAPNRGLFNRFAAWIMGVFTICASIAWLSSSTGDRGPLHGIGEFFGGIAVLEACIMLAGGPIMAIWYFSITLEEIRLVDECLRHRQEVHWKL